MDDLTFSTAVDDVLFAASVACLIGMVIYLVAYLARPKHKR
ncbi:MAG: hypothetical protein AAGI71_10665 [Bacteroidota bacterium]